MLTQAAAAVGHDSKENSSSVACSFTAATILRSRHRGRSLHGRNASHDDGPPDGIADIRKRGKEICPRTGTDGEDSTGEAKNGDQRKESDIGGEGGRRGEGLAAIREQWRMPCKFSEPLRLP